MLIIHILIGKPLIIIKAPDLVPILHRMITILRMRYIKAWDGLRCFMLISVIAFHLFYDYASYIWLLRYSLPAFFVLSGYLISQTILFQQEKPFLSVLKIYFIKRALRIFPVYYLVLIAAYLIYDIQYFNWAVVYLLNIKVFWLSFPNMSSPELINYLSPWQQSGVHFWSMGVEEQFYILLPLTLLPLAKRNQFKLVIAGIALSIISRNIFMYMYPQSFYGALPFISGEYIMWGCLLALFDFYKVDFNLPKESIIPLSVSIFLVTALSFGRSVNYKFGIFVPGNEQTFYAVSIALFIHGLKVSPESKVSVFLSHNFFVYIGKISYGVYLCHLFGHNILEWIILKVPFIKNVPESLSLFILSFIMGISLWHLFDKRINDYRKRFIP